MRSPQRTDVVTRMPILDPGPARAAPRASERAGGRVSVRMHDELCGDKALNNKSKKPLYVVGLLCCKACLGLSRWGAPARRSPGGGGVGDGGCVRVWDGEDACVPHIGQVARFAAACVLARPRGA